jgi:hypothetical protein
LDNARMEWNGKQSKTFDTFLTIYPNGRLWFPYHSIHWIMQEWNGMENKVKHLILSHNLSESKIVISLPFYPLDNARMEWKTK